jgi:hypothetical protein
MTAATTAAGVVVARAAGVQASLLLVWLELGSRKLARPSGDETTTSMTPTASDPATTGALDHEAPSLPTAVEEAAAAVAATVVEAATVATRANPRMEFQDEGVDHEKGMMAGET